MSKFFVEARMLKNKQKITKAAPGSYLREERTVVFLVLCVAN